MHHLLEVTIVCAIVLVLISGTVAVGTFTWASSCVAGHPGEQVRWTFPGGCELKVADTWITVGTTL